MAASLPNDTAVVVAFHAVMRLGAVWVGLNQLLAPPELVGLVEDSGARVFLCDSPEHLGRAPSCLEHVVTTAGAGTAGIDWSEVVDAARGGPVPRPVLDPDAPAAIAYTSGTTGRPKGVVHSQAGLLLPGASLVAARGYTPDLCKGDCLSLTILNLLVLSTLLVSQAQGTCVVMDAKDAAGHRRVDPHRGGEHLERGPHHALRPRPRRLGHGRGPGLAPGGVERRCTLPRGAPPVVRGEVRPPAPHHLRPDRGTDRRDHRGPPGPRPAGVERPAAPPPEGHRGRRRRARGPGRRRGRDLHRSPRRPGLGGAVSHHGRLLARRPTTSRRRPATGCCTPATSASSTATATSSWWTECSW